MFEVRAQAQGKFEVNLYGSISQWEKANATDFKNALNSAINSGAKEITLPTHSGGGSIYEGIAMGNVIKEARAKGVKVICRVDGLCASMAGVISATCDETHVAKNIRMMVHEGTIEVRGSAKTLRKGADHMDGLNDDIAEILSGKTGKTKEWIKENWLNGTDIWFTAQQAVDAKLADRVIEPKVLNLPPLSGTADWTQAAASYDTFFKTDDKMKEQLIAQLGLPATATEAEITAAIEALKNKPAAPAAAAPAAAAPAAPAVDAEKTKVVDAFMKIAAERGVTDAKQLESLKLVAGMNMSAAFDLLPKATPEDALRLSDVIAQLKGGSGAGVPADRANWTFNDWADKDPEGFGKMLDTNPKKYKELFKAEHGFEPTDADLTGV